MAGRRRNPVPALVVLAALPAVALGLLWRYAEARVPPKVDLSAPESSTPTTLPPVLGTPLLSVRRAPVTLSRDVNLAAFNAALQPVLAKIDSASCLAVSVDGQPVVSKNATVSLRPASNMKLLTASVALDVLGPDFRFTTTVSGALGANGVVNGDLYLIGGGDPVLSESWMTTATQIEKHPPFNVTPIESLVDSIVAAGVKQITGGVVGDGNRYDNELFAPTLAADVKAQLEALPVSALEVNDTRTSPTKVSNDPARGAAAVLLRLLQAKGIMVGGGSSSGVADPSAKTIATIQSQPLPAVLAEMLTTSDNLTAEMMLKEIGKAAGGAGTRVAGIKVVTDKLTAWGLDTTGVTMVDGSGLSDQNRLTCGVLLGVLERGTVTGPVGAGLPIGGDPRGTLDDIFTDAPLKGVIHAKTGTLNNFDGVPDKPGAKSLSGYVPLKGGGEIEFSMVLNGETISNKTAYRPIWTALGTVLASYPAGPGAAELGPR